MIQWGMVVLICGAAQCHYERVEATWRTFEQCAAFAMESTGTQDWQNLRVRAPDGSEMLVIDCVLSIGDKE